jgi:hypothetical protein
MADQTAVVVEEVAAPDFLNMSDEDMANFDPHAAQAAAAVSNANGGDTQDDGQVEETEEEKAATAAAAAALETDDNDGKGAGDETKTDKKVDVGSGAAAAKGGADEKTATTEQAAAAAKTGTTPEKVEGDGKAKSGDEVAKDESGAIDYKAEYEKLLKPFKANGRDIQAKSVEDAISLMQMGANYNKKMAGLKPAMKLVKMLEANGLLDETQLGFLIDVHKRDPAAINKLIVDSKMDPLDLSADKASEYKPGNHSVNEHEMELDDVISDLRGSEHFDRTLSVVASQWDPKSKGVIAANPQVLRVINGHMESGIYDLIAAELESERTFGRLKGLSDIDAYKQVGDAIEARGGFKHLNLGSAQAQAKSAPAAEIVAPKPKQADDDKLKAQKRAASGTKAAAPGAAIPADFNPFAMSDADFAKFKL